MNYFQHSASRRCYRCGHDLTDAASLLSGTGPVCRLLDNQVLATLIPANYPAALDAHVSCPVAQLVPETVATFKAIGEAFLVPNADTVVDWRKQVKRVEWMLSFPQPGVVRKALEAMVTALGYVGLVTLWHGEAATGEAKAQFQGERIYCWFPRNKGAKDSLKLIAGRRFHAEPAFEGAEKNGWSVPAHQGAAFKGWFQTHCPNHDAGALTTALDLAAEFTVKQLAVAVKLDPINPNPVVQVAVAPVVQDKPGCTIAASQDKPGWLLVKTPKYHGGFLQAVKALPGGDRRWNGEAWLVLAVHLSVIKVAAQSAYGTVTVAPDLEPGDILF